MPGLNERNEGEFEIGARCMILAGRAPGCRGRKLLFLIYRIIGLDLLLIFRNSWLHPQVRFRRDENAAMQYFVVMIDYGRRGREAIVDPEITRRQVISRIASGEYKNISFIHEIADSAVDDITAEILAEAAAPEIPISGADLQASGFDHDRDLRKHETA
jgi:hypothetical protein